MNLIILVYMAILVVFLNQLITMNMVILVNLLLLLILANPMIGESAVSEESVDTVECDVCGDFVHYGDPGEYGNTGDPGE